MGVAALSQPDFEALFESLPGLYLVVTPDAPRYTVVAVTDACLRATRTVREELVGRGLFEVFRDSASSTEAASLEEVIRTRRPDARATNSPLFGVNGEITHIVHRMEDMTGEQHEEHIRALRRANDALSALVEMAPDGIFVANHAGRITNANQAGCSLVGYSLEELQKKRVIDMIPDEEVGRWWQVRARLVAGDTGEVDVGEWTGVRKDGSRVPIEASVKILPDGRWLFFVRDVSTRRDLETALRSLNEDLNRAQSVAKIGSWRLDIARNELWWSDETYRIFGLQRGTPMTYETFLASVHPDERDHVDLAWKAALQGAPYDIEHRLVVAGETKWVREKADLEFGAHGSLLGGVGIVQDITERKRFETEQQQAQEILREWQERFDLAIKGAGLALWDWNVKTDEVLFSPRWAEMLGVPPEAVKPHISSWTSIIHPDDQPHVQKSLADHFEGRATEYRCEHRVRTGSGQWKWIYDLGRVFTRDEQGRPVRMVGLVLDIDDRKRLEEELRLAEAMSSGIVSTAADAIICLDESQRITMFNEGASSIFGYSKAEAIGAPLDMLLPERLRPIHRQHVERFATAHQTARHMGERSRPIFGLRKNGEEFPADASISKLEIDGRRILTVALRDVSEQQRFQNAQTLLAEMGALVASTLEYEQTLSNIADLTVRSLADVCVVDLADGEDIRRLKVVCRDKKDQAVCERLLGLPLGRMRTPLARQVFETRKPLLLERLTPELIASASRSDEHLSALRDLAPQSVIAVPLVARGTLLGALTIVSTTPSRLYREADLRLVEEVAYRASLAIENARLYRSARLAIQARDDLLGVVAHDLRNPLGTILMQAALLHRSRTESEVTRGGVERIERAAARMNRLIEDLLDIARIESGRLRVDRRDTSARQVISDALDSQQTRAAAAGVKLVSAATTDLPGVFADRERLLQIFENLLGNALKFTPRGGTISVGARRHDDNVEFWVADTGTGIDPDQLPHVFERFWQARGTGRKGAGLGLAIVKGVVEQHGGRVRAESTLGRGSTFFFTIPITMPAGTRRSSVPSLPEAVRPSAPA